MLVYSVMSAARSRHREHLAFVELASEPGLTLDDEILFFG
jgi:hypothetical protein